MGERARKGKKGNTEAERRKRERGKEGGRKKGGGRQEKGMDKRNRGRERGAKESRIATEVKKEEHKATNAKGRTPDLPPGCLHHCRLQLS